MKDQLSRDGGTKSTGTRVIRIYDIVVIVEE